MYIGIILKSHNSAYVCDICRFLGSRGEGIFGTFTSDFTDLGDGS